MTIQTYRAIMEVGGLQLGADDYLTKPFHLAKLSARLQSVVRRRHFGGQTEIQVRGLTIRPDARQVIVSGQPLELTRKEYDLFHLPFWGHSYRESNSSGYS